MLKVIIAGGGIAGLTAASAIRRAGHSVYIFERSSWRDEVGAAIHVPPNATRALLAWGLDPRRGRFVKVRSSFRARGDTMERFFESTEVEKMEQKYGAPWFLAHRVDLHEELKRMVLEQPEGKGEATVKLGAEIVSFDPSSPSITLLSGEIVKGDILIAADGIHSRAIEAVLGRANPPMPSKDHNNFCYRFLIPARDIAEDEQTAAFIDGDDGRMKFFVGEGKRLIAYPCRDNEIQNFVGMFHQSDASLMSKEDWHASVDKSKLLDLFSDFHPQLKAVMQKATDVKQWALLYRRPIPTWTKEKMVLAGDAAHPMLPHQGQGGAQSIEDGVVLGIVLSGVTEPGAAVERLRLYDAIRRNRASLVQVFSNAGQDQPELIHQEASAYVPLEKVPKNPDEFCDFNMGYDVVEDSVKQLKEADPAFVLPEGFFQTTPGRGMYP